MKYRLFPFIAAVFGILLIFSLSGCENVWMKRLLKPWEEKEEPDILPDVPVIPDLPVTPDVPVTPGVPVTPPVVTYTITFNTDGGSIVPNQTVTEGGAATRPQNPAKSGYGFVNWYDNAGLAEPHYDFATPITHDLTLYAKWSQTFYTVSFVSNGGSAVDYQTVGEGGTASEPIPSWQGSAFIAWYSDPDFTYVYDFETPVTANITLYARWITYDDADFGLGAVITNIFDVYNASDWGNAVSTINSNGSGNAGSSKNYVINVMDNFAVEGVVEATFTGTYIKVSLRGDKILTLTGTGNLIRISANQTVILRDLTLKGHAANDNSVVYVSGTNNSSSGTFTMQGGKISDNTTTTNYTGGGVFLSSSNTPRFRIVTGTIYGLNEADTSLINRASLGGAAFYKESNTAEHGTQDGTVWTPSGDLPTSNDTIRVQDGVLQ